jgi:hypothetical protein
VTDDGVAPGLKSNPTKIRSPAAVFAEKATDKDLALAEVELAAACTMPVDEDAPKKVIGKLKNIVMRKAERQRLRRRAEAYLCALCRFWCEHSSRRRELNAVGSIPKGGGIRTLSVRMNNEVLNECT